MFLYLAFKQIHFYISENNIFQGYLLYINIIQNQFFCLEHIYKQIYILNFAYK